MYCNHNTNWEKYNSQTLKCAIRCHSHAHDVNEETLGRHSILNDKIILRQSVLLLYRCMVYNYTMLRIQSEEYLKQLFVLLLQNYCFAPVATIPNEEMRVWKLLNKLEFMDTRLNRSTAWNTS